MKSYVPVTSLQCVFHTSWLLKQYQNIIFVFMWPCFCSYMCINIAIIKKIYIIIAIMEQDFAKQCIDDVSADWRV